MALEYSFSPSELDYKAKKCPRCFYIHKHYKINPGDRPPPVFSSFDAVQKPYFKKTNTRSWCDDLPDGEIMDSSELPGKIVSEGLQDNKQRKFKLSGNPDIVIRFKEKGFGIVDFKTTTISSDKAEKIKSSLSFLKNKAKTLEDIYKNGQYIISDQVNFNNEDLKLIDQTSKKIISEFNGKITRLNELKREFLEPIINELIKSNNTNFKGVGQPLRIALTGSRFGPGIYDIITSLGKEEVIKRLSNKIFS